MDEIVPSVLQRLRAADIIRMAGLTAASLGQEYCRIGAVYATKRQSARLSGIVDVTGVAHGEAASPTILAETSNAPRHQCAVEVEIQGSGTWTSACACHAPSATLCQHAAALLYEWLAHPQAFSVLSSLSPTVSTLPSLEESAVAGRAPRPRPIRRVAIQRGPMPTGNPVEILGLLGLTELRGIAREYDIATTSVGKSQLIEAILETLKQPEAIRRVAGTLDKPQRQLLATIVLAGGSIIDDDLSGMFERFSLGRQNQLQPMLVVLQNKGLLFRTGMSIGQQQRTGLSRSTLDIGWYIPPDVRVALRVTVPVTPFTVKDGEDLQVQRGDPQRLLADLLLVTRLLDGYRLQPGDEKEESSTASRSLDVLSLVRSPGVVGGEGTGDIPAPSGISGPALLAVAQEEVERTPAFLRFAVRLLRLADILYKDDGSSSSLRSLANAAQLFLGPTRTEVMQDLFDLWLTHTTYEELFDLQDEELHLRCRTTALNHPVLRPGELEAENSEARQWLVGLLSQAPLNQWISFPAFARFVYRLNPAFLQRRQRLFSTPHWWFEQEEGRVLQPTHFNDWLRIEGRYLVRLLRGPLHWWGVTDLAVSDDGRLLAFRLTTTAELLLGNGNGEQFVMEHLPEDLDSLVDVQEGAELLVACAVTVWPLIELLEQFAEAVGVRAGRLCYRLSQKSLSEAMSQGKQPASLLEYLRQLLTPDTESRAGASPALGLLHQLEDWLAQYGRVRLYTGVTLLEVADTLAMRELTATTSVEEQIVRTLSPTQYILKKTASERLNDELKRRGQVPLLHEETYGTE